MLRTVCIKFPYLTKLYGYHQHYPSAFPSSIYVKRFLRYGVLVTEAEDKQTSRLLLDILNIITEIYCISIKSMLMRREITY